MLNALFSPAVALLNRLRYPWKFAALAVVSLLAIGFLLAGLVDAKRAQMRHLQDEMSGMDALAQVMVFVEAVQQHGGLSAAVLVGRDAALEARLRQARAAVQGALGAADAAYVGVGASAAVMQRWEQAKDQWQALAESGMSMAQVDNRAAHAKLVATALQALRRMADESGLTTDGATDSSILISALLRGLPDTGERLGRLRAVGSGALSAMMIDADTRFYLGTQLGELNKTLGELDENLARAAEASPMLAAAIDRMRQDLASAVTAVRGELGKILEDNFDTTPAAFFETGTKAMDLVFHQAMEVMLPTVRTLLATRYAAARNDFAMAMGVSLFAVLLLLYVAVAAYLAILGSVRELSAGAASLAAGDLTARIAFSARDELRDVAEQFNAMSAAFAEVIRQVQSGAEQVSQASTALAQSSAQVAQSSEAQSDAASSMAAAVEEMTVGIDEISRHASVAEDISTRSGSLSDEGAHVVSDTVSEMEQIASGVNNAAEVIEKLGAASTQISSIVKSIKEIADQTNLLALNAAIEAARAGEMGRGFAVVADEVRKLAERTGSATEEIAAMVVSVQQGTSDAVAAMNDGVARVRSGVALTSRAGDAMAQIRDGARQVVASVSDISQALREQSTASTEIARNVERIARMAEENNGAVGETASTANRLEGLATQLQGNVARFRV